MLQVQMGMNESNSRPCSLICIAAAFTDIFFFSTIGFFVSSILIFTVSIFGIICVTSVTISFIAIP